jgi:hypothetical protein
VALVASGLVLLGGCNSILGITAATQEPDDSGGDAGPPSLTCAFYCATVMQNCTGPNLEYLDMPTCMTACPIFEPGTSFTTDTADDTLGCRIYHALAAAGDPSYHCRHAGPVGGDHCGMPCEAFCNLDTSYCAAPNPVAYSSPTLCQADCANYTYLTGSTGDLTQTGGDTLNCRVYHLEAAFASMSAAQYHCPHTEPVSAVCFNPDAGAADAGGE